MPRIALELLRLLAADAPAEQIEEKARALAAEDPDDGEAARELALRVRAGLDAHRRREAELSALVDTARDLASMPDPGGVLDAIVRRARTLLRADVAYLTLYDPDRGDTYMRATAGSVSARFQALRLPLGAGLGGLVAQTRRPYWSADYPADEQFRHTGEIDAAVDDEGLIGICGTPLLVGDEFVGVLFASHRTRRAYHHDEVALLGSLAALAAVSLVQSRRAAATAADPRRPVHGARGHRPGRGGARPLRRRGPRRRWCRRHRGGARRGAGVLGGGARRRREPARGARAGAGRARWLTVPRTATWTARPIPSPTHLPCADPPRRAGSPRPTACGPSP